MVAFTKRCAGLASALLIVAANCAASEDLVLVWNDLTLRAIRYANVPPPLAVRQMAVVHLAVFDALNGIEQRYTPYLITNEAPANCPPEVAASAAAHYTLRALFPKSAEML